MEGGIGDSAIDNVTKIYTDSLQCAVRFHAIQHTMGGNRVFLESIGRLYEGFHCCNVSINLIHTWAENSPLDFHHVLVTVQSCIYADTILVHEVEVAVVKFTNTENG